MNGRRAFLKLAAAAGLAPAIASAQSAGRVVVVGGGFAGATCARMLKTLEPGLSVTLVEAEKLFTPCPMSSEVIAGLRELKDQEFGYEGIRRAGIEVATNAATSVEPGARRLRLSDGRQLAYDRLVIAPGIGIDWKALPGYDQKAAETLPHAWKAGPQTSLLRRQIEAMDDGGLVVMSLPEGLIRCPPAPYERASLIAHYLKTRKPRSKILILDAKDSFSQQRLFQGAWKELYPGLIEWVPLSQAGKVTSVDAATRTFTTDFESHKAAVGNVIPPQRAAPIALSAGVADRTGWCPVEPRSFESTLQPGIHVLGDAAVLSGLAKSAYIASAAAKVCAAAIVARLSGRAPVDPQLGNICYSMVAPDYAFSMKHLYRPQNGQLVEMPGGTSISPIEAPAARRSQEAREAQAWFRAVTSEMFA
jgi:NADPH-dependent 2,4-dienoyl-CoA reductase/sulfur reductase-like enzyme